MKGEDFVLEAPVFKKGNFVLNFPKAIAEFESIIKNLPVRKILYRTVFRGKGLEFDSYRPFGPDDDADLIDWAASLRANELIAREYIEERDLNVYFLVDVSNSMLFGSNDRLKAEYVAELVASIGHLVLHSGDRIGLVMFSDDVVKFVKASGNRNQFPLFTKFLSDSNLYGGGFNIDKAIDMVLKTTKSDYTVFIVVSDFVHVHRRNERSLKLLGARFETMALMVRDPMDDNLPDFKYQLSISDPYSSKQLLLDPGVASGKYRETVLFHRNVLEDIFKKSQVDYLELLTDKSFTVPFVSFLKSRAGGKRG